MEVESSKRPAARDLATWRSAPPDPLQRAAIAFRTRRFASRDADLHVLARAAEHFYSANPWSRIVAIFRPDGAIAATANVHRVSRGGEVVLSSVATADDLTPFREDLFETLLEFAEAELKGCVLQVLVAEGEVGWWEGRGWVRRDVLDPFARLEVARVAGIEWVGGEVACVIGEDEAKRRDAAASEAAAGDDKKKKKKKIETEE
jgi:hypothetical protein